MKLKYLTLLFFLLDTSLSVDKNNFKTCEQSSFCRRCRKILPDNSPYEFEVSTLKTYTDHITAELLNKDNGHLFLLKLEALKGNTFRVQIDEKTPLKPRYRVVDSLNGPPILNSLSVTDKSESEVTIKSGPNKVIIQSYPFKIDFYNSDVLSVSVNGKGLMKFEQLRRKPSTSGDEGEKENEENDLNLKSIEDDDPGSWDENFKSHHDAKPNGPEAVALDFTFPQADVLFGIPEHADSFALKSTNGGEPYRLYNLDVFEYELDNGMALYGSVPVIYGHGPERTTGVFWMNPSETWVDIHNSNTENNVMSSIVNFVSGTKQTDPPAAHFMSESGIMDIFIMLGPTPLAAFKQYTDLTGNTQLPQLFAIGYHQSRWNYNDEQDIAAVHSKFDEYDMPVDTFWLDIEYTDGKKYFTWDQHKFAHPTEMVHNLTAKGRHLVVIIDPHIKRDNNYFFHNDCTDKGYYVKNKDGKDYEGWCWPGAASYPDFFDPVVRKYYADQYLLDHFHGTTSDVMIWNDMNEPSVFNGPEITMLKDNLHFGNWEHRHIHNLYGHMHLMGTFDGLMRRSGGTQRPFILSRAHFSGSQRFAAIWTGDNFAEWGHLAASIKMCLSESVAGFSFCGADIGGFFGNPDAELLERWYQAAAFQPFMRAHAHIDTKRREPWLFPETTRLVIREILRKRYSYLSFWYTMFFEHERNGYPIMRPLLAHYPKDKEAFRIDYEYLLSDSLLVRPVMQKGVNKVDVYFPLKGEKEHDIWYDVDTFKKFDKSGFESIPVDNFKVPVFQRGGSIIPKKERVRRAATLMSDDPYTLIVCLDKNNEAYGTLYIDDEKSYEYKNGKYIYLKFEYKNGVLTSKSIDEKATYPTKSWLERVILVGLDRVPVSATLTTSDGSSTTLDLLQKNNAYVVRKPGVSVLDKWSIKVSF